MKALLTILIIIGIIVAVIFTITGCNTTTAGNRTKYFGFEDNGEECYYTFDKTTGQTIKILGKPPRAENALDKLFKLIGWEKEQELELIKTYNIDGTILREYKWR